MKLTKAQKFLLIILGLFAVTLYYGWSNGVFIVDWNGFFNSTLQSLVAGIIMIPVTIIAYRYLYHRKSKT